MKALSTFIMLLFFLSQTAAATGSAPESGMNRKLSEYLATIPEYAQTKAGMIRLHAGKSTAVGVATHRAANEFAPENTLSAMQCALDLEADFIEIDVRQTKDSMSVILHDGNLDRTTNGKGPLKNLNLNEARALSAGEWFAPFFHEEKIPTLEEVCLMVSNHNKTSPHKTFLYVDCKDINAKVLIECLEKYSLLEGSVFYVNNPKSQINQLRSWAPKAKVMPGLSSSKDLGRIIEAYQPYALDVSWKELSKELIDKAHSMGVKIFSDGFGENQTSGSYAAAIQAGIDVISTNKISVICEAATQLRH
jgi:glycerophosphoryl diester phosphodiesterase